MPTTTNEIERFRRRIALALASVPLTVLPLLGCGTPPSTSERFGYSNDCGTHRWCGPAALVAARASGDAQEDGCPRRFVAPEEETPEWADLGYSPGYVVDEPTTVT